MTPLLYLREEYENVSRTLNETLRHDYGPSDGEAYYSECCDRLAGVKRAIDGLGEGDDRIADQLATLEGIANRVSLIERSHLGEFSWPFARTIRDIADKLLVERNLRRDLSPPIVHMIAEGTGYHIRNEKNPDLHVRRKIAIVAFPRQLKHHVLMHAIFGHELGHAALYTNVAGRICGRKVIPELRRTGALRDEQSLEDWLRDEDAPIVVRDRVARAGDLDVQISQVELWSVELMCDLFGLLVFGPAFVAAHRTLLEPASRSPLDLELKNSTHPPLAVRRRLLTTAMRILGWDRPTIIAEGAARRAEAAMLQYVMADGGEAWPTLMEEAQLRAAIGHLSEVFEPHPELRAAPPPGAVTEELVDRLARRLPPILESVDRNGRAEQREMKADQCLYAGWTYWFGREELGGDAGPLTFLQTNRLCDYALLQQQAISMAAAGLRQ